MVRGNFAEDQENGLKFPYNTWMKTARTDGGQDPYKLLFANDGRTIFRSHAGYEFRNSKDQQLVAIDGNGVLYAQGRNILAELDQCVRRDRQYYIDIGVRANGDGCCGNGSGLIIHHAGPNGPAHAWSDKGVTTKFNFRQA